MADMRFLYEQFERYRDTGMASHRAGKREEARYNLLRAAECLLKLAHAGDAELRQSRVLASRRLVELAKSLPDAETAPQALSQESEGKEGGQQAKWRMEGKPGVTFQDIAGLEEVKEVIRRKVVYPFQYPDITARYKKRAGGGVLLYGPPGTGKTMLAKAIASELDAAFFSVKCSDIMSKWVGEAEKNLKELFEEARRQPCAVVFLDETEALVGKRGGDSTIMNRLIPEFLAQVDGVDTAASSLLLLGATNRPWDMDEAALRPGRFGQHIYVGLPDEPARRHLIETHLTGIPVEEEVDLEVLVARSAGYSGADIVGLVARITDRPYSREIAGGSPDMVNVADVQAALDESGPSVSREMLSRYERFARTKPEGTSK